VEMSADFKPTILLNTHVYPRHSADHVAPFMHDFAKACSTFARVVVHCPHAHGLAENEIIDGIEIRRFRYASDKKETLAYRGDMHKQVFGSPFKALLFIKFLRRWRKATKLLIKEISPDIVHAHWLFPGGYVTEKALTKGKRFYLSMHGTDVFLVKKRKLARGFAKRVLRRSEKAHFVSTALQEIITETCSRKPKDTDLILPMVFGLDDFVELSNGEKTGGFLFVGRLLEVKGVDVLIRSFSELCGSGETNWTLDIVGDGRERENLQSLVDKLELGNKVIFHGSLKPSQVKKMYQNSRALVLPSITTESGEQEGLGVVLLEAMSAGIPVIGTDCGGIPEIIHHEETGLLVSQNDVSSLCAALKRLQEDSELRESLVAGGKKFIQSSYTGNAMVDSIGEWYVNKDGVN
jgi:glycosyltransferase involved in cell wall biosynthesis